MEPSKSKDSKNSGRQENNSDSNEEEEKELCPGFKDVDAFVKVSKRNQLERVSTQATA